MYASRSVAHMRRTLQNLPFVRRAPLLSTSTPKGGALRFSSWSNVTNIAASNKRGSTLIACGIGLLGVGAVLGLQQQRAKCAATPTSHRRPGAYTAYDIPLTPDFPNSMPCFIEVSKGSRNKYEWDSELGFLRLDRVLHSAVFYPHNYGFIPQTLCKDGDALDVLVLGEPCVPGSIVDIRPIGYMLMEDEKGIDEKVLAVPTHDPRFDEFHTLEDVPVHLLMEIGHFFETYKALEKTKWSKVGGWKGTEDTKILIEATHRYFLINKQQEILEEYNRDVYKIIKIDSDKLQEDQETAKQVAKEISKVRKEVMQQAQEEALEDYDKENSVDKSAQKVPLNKYESKIHEKVKGYGFQDDTNEVRQQVQKQAMEGYNEGVYTIVRKKSREPLEKYNSEVYDNVNKEALENYNQGVYKMVRRESQKPLEEYNSKVYNEVQQQALENYNDGVYKMVRRESQKPLEEYNSKVYNEVQQKALENYNEGVYNMVRRESQKATPN